MKTFKHAEMDYPTGAVRFIYPNGFDEIPFETLVAFVEQEELHCTDITGAKLDYHPTIEEWLDSGNWDKATGLYFKHYLLG